MLAHFALPSNCNAVQAFWSWTTTMMLTIHDNHSQHAREPGNYIHIRVDSQKGLVQFCPHVIPKQIEKLRNSFMRLKVTAGLFES